MSWKRSDYPKLAPVSLEAGPPLTWGMLVRGMCRVYGIHQECGCPLADPESVKPVENPEPAADPESATGVTLQPVDSTGKAT